MGHSGYVARSDRTEIARSGLQQAGRQVLKFHAGRGKQLSILPVLRQFTNRIAWAIYGCMA